ncbi:MAG: hypothetical protein Q7R85_00975 [bacterium]|nr:hypothetical protein [bacterium]
MSRTLYLVAMCALALVVVAQFVMADEETATCKTKVVPSTSYVPPENGVTNLYGAMTPNGTSPDMTKEELIALAEKNFAGEPEKTSRVMDDGAHEYWTYIWNAKGREDECHVTLVVTLVKDKDEVYKVRGTMYTAQGNKQGHSVSDGLPVPPAKDGESKMNEPENPCHQAFADIKLGMTADELDALYQKYVLEGGHHPIMASTEKKVWKGRCGNDKESGEVWETHWQECGELRPFPYGPPIWMADLTVHLWDGKVVDATYKPMQVRVEMKDEHWK